MKNPEAPRLVSAPTQVSQADLEPYGEWRDQLVVETDVTARCADHVEISACELRGVRLTGADLEHLRLVDVLLVDCELSGALLHGSSWVRVELENCRATGLVLATSGLVDVRLVGCKLDGANLRFLRAERIRFDSCSLVGVDCYEATFTDAEFERCDLTDAEFSKAAMTGVRLAGSTLERVRGASSLAGAIVTSEQVLPLALGVFADLGIVVEDGEDREA